VLTQGVSITGFYRKKVAMSFLRAALLSSEHSELEAAVEEADAAGLSSDGTAELRQAKAVLALKHALRSSEHSELEAAVEEWTRRQMQRGCQATTQQS
jgi:hypothetical protein